MLINHYTNSYEYAFHIPSGCGRKDTCMHPCMHIDIQLHCISCSCSFFLTCFNYSTFLLMGLLNQIVPSHL